MSERHDASRLPDLPSAHGGPRIQARLKSTPEDFRVVEDLGFELDGSGEHLFLQLRKRDLNTQDVVERLQRRLALKPVDIGIAGLKDRRAVADQWVSLRGVSDEAARAAVDTLFDDRAADSLPLQILQSRRHGRKLRRGAHRCNRFEIVLRDVRIGDDTLPVLPSTSPAAQPSCRDVLAAQVEQLAALGFPNYFGAQRFGLGGRNLDAALRYFASGGRQRLARQRRGLLLSAARSALFNQVCAARVRAGTWLTPMSGEPLVLAGTQSYFLHEPGVGSGVDARGAVNGAAMQSGRSDMPGDSQRRIMAGDVHTSGPLWGRGDPIADDDCLAFERAVLSDQSMIRSGLEEAGLEVHRRPLRCRPAQLVLSWLSDEVLRVTVELPKGVFATSLLAELVQES